MASREVALRPEQDRARDPRPPPAAQGGCRFHRRADQRAADGAARLHPSAAADHHRLLRLVLRLGELGRARRGHARRRQGDPVPPGAEGAEPRRRHRRCDRCPRGRGRRAGRGAAADRQRARGERSAREPAAPSGPAGRARPAARRGRQHGAHVSARGLGGRARGRDQRTRAASGSPGRPAVRDRDPAQPGRAAGAGADRASKPGSTSSTRSQALAEEELAITAPLAANRVVSKVGFLRSSARSTT